MNETKGIILAGGKGTRLNPLTKVVSKQLLPVYDKPMIYYPLATLMSSGIKEICIIVNSGELSLFENVLSDGSQWGIKLEFIIQPEPEGLPQAYLLAENFIDGKQSCLILGDNLFVGSGLGRNLRKSVSDRGFHVFLYEVDNPRNYGNVRLDEAGKITEIVEKPEIPLSNFAIPGIYFADSQVFEYTKLLKKSKREEYEIVDLINSYKLKGELTYTSLSRGTAWLDTGSVEDLFAAAEFVRIIQNRQGRFIACLEEIAIRNGWMDIDDLSKSPIINLNSHYSKYLRKLLETGIDFEPTT